MCSDVKKCSDETQYTDDDNCSDIEKCSNEAQYSDDEESSGDEQNSDVGTQYSTVM
jgi:hypothetical protein